VEDLRAAEATRTRAVAAVLALQTQANLGRPFGEQLTTVERLAPRVAAVSKLRAYAEEGLPSVNALQARYDAAAREAQQAAKRAAASDNAVRRLWANFTNLITIRPTGEVEGDSVPAILSRAETRLETGDLYAAVRELEALEGEPAAAMQDWLAQARARLAVDELIETLNDEIIEGM